PPPAHTPALHDALPTFATTGARSGRVSASWPGKTSIGPEGRGGRRRPQGARREAAGTLPRRAGCGYRGRVRAARLWLPRVLALADRKSTRLNSSHVKIS